MRKNFFKVGAAALALTTMVGAALAVAPQIDDPDNEYAQIEDGNYSWDLRWAAWDAGPDYFDLSEVAAVKFTFSNLTYWSSDTESGVVLNGNGFWGGTIFNATNVDWNGSQIGWNNSNVVPVLDGDGNYKEAYLIREFKDASGEALDLEAAVWGDSTEEAGWKWCKIVLAEWDNDKDGIAVSKVQLLDSKGNDYLEVIASVKSIEAAIKALNEKVAAAGNTEEDAAAIEELIDTLDEAVAGLADKSKDPGSAAAKKAAQDKVAAINAAIAKAAREAELADLVDGLDDYVSVAKNVIEDAEGIEALIKSVKDAAAKLEAGDNDSNYQASVAAAEAKVASIYRSVDCAVVKDQISDLLKDANISDITTLVIAATDAWTEGEELSVDMQTAVARAEALLSYVKQAGDALGALVAGDDDNGLSELVSSITGSIDYSDLQAACEDFIAAKENRVQYDDIDNETLGEEVTNGMSFREGQYLVVTGVCTAHEDAEGDASGTVFIVYDSEDGTIEMDSKVYISGAHNSVAYVNDYNTATNLKEITDLGYIYYSENKINVDSYLDDLKAGDDFCIIAFYTEENTVVCFFTKTGIDYYVVCPGKAKYLALSGFNCALSEIESLYTDISAFEEVNSEQEYVVGMEDDYSEVTEGSFHALWTSNNEEVVSIASDGTEVMALKAGEATLTAKDVEGKVVATIIVTVKDPEVIEKTYGIGDVENFSEYSTLYPDVTFTSTNEAVITVDDEGRVKAVAPGHSDVIVMSGDAVVATICGTVEFKDVKNTKKYFYKPVYWACENGITKGYADGTFGVEKECYREDLVVFLWRLMGKPEPKATESPFKDIANGKYYTKAVIWAYETGITKGYADGTFGYHKTITREDTMTFFYRAAGKPEISTNVSTFPDVVTGKYYNRPVIWAAEQGIAKGYSEGEYKGMYGVGVNCSREDIVTFMYRYSLTLEKTK